MKFRALLATAALALSTTAVLADDFDGYYSRAEHRLLRSRRSLPTWMPTTAARAIPMTIAAPPDHRQSYYDRDCHAGTAAGTATGAAGGGLIGGAASHGNPAAIIGGIFLGGLLGNALSRDVDCDDQRYAYDSYHDGLYGEVGHRYEWNHGGNRGYFVATREFNDDGDRCREFTTVTYRHGEELRHDGVACYDNGEWRTRDG